MICNIIIIMNVAGKTCAVGAFIPFVNLNVDKKSKTDGDDVEEMMKRVKANNDPASFVLQWSTHFSAGSDKENGNTLVGQQIFFAGLTFIMKRKI